MPPETVEIKNERRSERVILRVAVESGYNTGQYWPQKRDNNFELSKVIGVVASQQPAQAVLLCEHFPVEPLVGFERDNRIVALADSPTRPVSQYGQIQLAFRSYSSRTP
jgi:hypothetical protein